MILKIIKDLHSSHHHISTYRDLDEPTSQHATLGVHRIYNWKYNPTVYVFTNYMIWTLFVKQHNTTGLKYLGDPDEGNPFTYKGSGQYWLAHLRKHRKDFSTYIIGQYETQSELKEASNYYFDLWNVAESRNQKTGKGVFADDIK